MNTILLIVLTLVGQARVDLTYVGIAPDSETCIEAMQDIKPTLKTNQAVSCIYMTVALKDSV